MRSRVRQRIWDWLPVAIWLGILIVESTDLMSSEHTGGLLRAVLSKVFHHLDAARLELINHGLRKTGHFLGYGVLCLLFFRALRDTFGGTLRRWTLLAIGLTFAVASLDEIHQRFLPSRTGRWQDVLIDTGGAACLQILVLIALRWRGRKVNRPGCGEVHQMQADLD